MAHEPAMRIAGPQLRAPEKWPLTPSLSPSPSLATAIEANVRGALLPLLSAPPWDLLNLHSEGYRYTTLLTKNKNKRKISAVKYYLRFSTRLLHEAYPNILTGNTFEYHFLINIA